MDIKTLRKALATLVTVGCTSNNAVMTIIPLAETSGSTCKSPLSFELCTIEGLATAAIYFTPCTTRERINRSNGCTVETRDLRNTDPSSPGWEFNTMTGPEQKAARKRYKQNLKKEMEQTDE